MTQDRWRRVYARPPEQLLAKDRKDSTPDDDALLDDFVESILTALDDEGGSDE